MRSKKPNIVWLIPDGIRTVKYDDPFGRFDFFENLKKDGFSEYKNMYTATPSTFMSFTSVLTGVYSTLLANGYGELKATKQEIGSIDEVLKEQGYKNYFFSFYAGLREQFDVFYNTIENLSDKESFLKYYYECFLGNCLDKYVNKVIDKTDFSEPFCFFYHMNFYDDDIEKYFEYDFNKDFENIYKKLVKKVDIQNTIFIVHSDHGYPIYRGEDDAEFLWSHDEVMTQENIKVPFFIKYANKEFNNLDENRTLVDLYATILELLGIKSQKFLSGTSLFEKRQEYVKIVNRFSNQQRQVISLICDDKKLSYYNDTDEFKLYELADIVNEKALEEVPQSFKDKFINLNQTDEDKKNELIKKNFELKKQKLKNTFCHTKKFLYLKNFDNSYLDKMLNDFDIDEFKANLLDKETVLVLCVKTHLEVSSKLYDKEIQIIKTNSCNEVIIVDTFLNLKYIQNVKTFFQEQEKLYENKIKRDARSLQSRNLMKVRFINKMKNSALKTQDIDIW